MTRKNVMRTVTGFAVSVLLFSNMFISVLAAGTGTAKQDGTKVRSDAGTGYDVVTSISKDTTVTVGDTKADANGDNWYSVTLSDGTTGYIRSDLLNVTEDAAADTTDEATAETTDANVTDGTNTAGVDITSVTLPDGVSACDYQLATVSVTTGKIRPDASTSNDPVATLDQNTQVVICGTQTGSDSNTWYYIAFVKDGSQQYGFIRSDLVTLGDVITIEAPVEEVPEETAVEETTEDTAPVNNDYELVYTDDGTGNEVWYLYNHIDNTREKLQELLDYATGQQQEQSDAVAQVKTYKILIIALAAVLVIAIIVIVLLIIRLRSGEYVYEEYDEEEEDDEEEEEEIKPAASRFRGRRRAEEEEDDEEEEDEEEEPAPRASRTKASQTARRQAEKTKAKTVRVERYDDEEDDEEDEEPVRKRPQKNNAQRRAAHESAPRRAVSYDRSEDEVKLTPRKSTRPKNFVLDDDDFEFEFLNMDDK